MATLVQFLAAGVNGAASGTATFLLRGSASSAASMLYTDFEESAQPGTNVIVLDANGSAEIYCDAYVDVVIRNSAGTTLRTVTLGHSAPVVEVQSVSFTGTAYDGDPANTVGEPVTLQEVLDRWEASAGAPDWQVDIDGTPTNLSSAFLSFAGMFINVKDPQYGAAGDGVTNDTAAISNAIGAAFNGGVVVFPPGTYLVGPLAVNNASVAMVGWGQAIIRATSGTTFTFSASATNRIKLISGLKFEGNGSAVSLISILASDNNIIIENCHFDETGFTSNLINISGGNGRHQIRGCKFLLGTSSTLPAIRHTGGTDNSVVVEGCFFDIPFGFVNTVIRGSCFIISDCDFDGSAVTTGSYIMLDPHDPSDSALVGGTVTGCSFYDGGSSGTVFALTTVGEQSVFVESSNRFFEFSAPYAYSNDASYDTSAIIVLGSRKARQFNITNASFPTLTVGAPLAFELFVVNHTNAANVTVEFTGTDRPVGLSWDVVVLNNSGGARDVTFGGTGQSATVSAVADGGRAFAHMFTYLESTGVVCTAVAGTGIAAT